MTFNPHFYLNLMDCLLLWYNCLFVHSNSAIFSLFFFRIASDASLPKSASHTVLFTGHRSLCECLGVPIRSFLQLSGVCLFTLITSSMHSLILSWIIFTSVLNLPINFCFSLLGGKLIYILGTEIQSWIIVIWLQLNKICFYFSRLK